MSNHLPCKDQIGCGSSDGLYEYKNGFYCFSCHKNWSKLITKSTTFLTQGTQLTKKDLKLTENIPNRLMIALKLKGLYDEEIVSNDISYSKELDMLAFPFRRNESVYLRGFNPRKDLLVGEKHLYFPDTNVGIQYFSNVLVLVEDICSAIIVNRHCYAAAICGSKIGNLSTEIPKNIDSLILWYDPDKAGKQGMLTDMRNLQNRYKIRRIHSKKDPKYHAYNEIVRYLQVVI